MDLDPPAPRIQREQRPPSSTANKWATVPAPALPNFDHVRDNIRTQSAGIFQGPSPYYSSRLSGPADRFPNIPPRADFAHISRSYLDTVHEIYPILHWPTFQSEIDQVYTSRSFDGMSKEWVGMYFAMLACGSLNITATTPHGHNSGREFYDVASQAMTPWPQDPTTVHVRLLFLLGLYATESGMKSEGSMWHASSVRVAQMLSLNHSDPTQSPFEAEMRRRLWWAIYVQDRCVFLFYSSRKTRRLLTSGRLTSFGANLSFAIDERDSEDSLPTPIQDRYIGLQPIPHVQNAQDYPFVMLIRITRIFSGVYQTVKSSRVYAPELRTHEEQFQSILSQLPEPLRPDSDARLEPLGLLPILMLDLARFQLYRRNLSPVCPPEDRIDALNNCTNVARDTARALQRTLQAPDADRDCLRRVASTMVCIHLWRCILILCLQKDFQAALLCVRASAALAESRKVNTACGKYILFFLEQLAERNRRGNSHMYKPTDDEELLAYASGDLQSGLEQSWAWAGATPGSAATSPHTRSQPHAKPYGSNESMSDRLPIRSHPNSSDDATRQWPGWGAAEHSIKTLMGSQKRIAPGASSGPGPTYYPPPHNPVKRVQLASDVPNMSPSKPPPTPSNASRISIANII